MANIYTKTGDEGETGLLGGERISKDSIRINAYGTIDEASSMIGLAYSLCKNENTKKILKKIQTKLITVGAELASTSNSKKHLVDSITEKDVKELEEIIEEIIERIGKQTEFVIPGSDPVSSSLHVARSIIRRAERSIIKLSKTEDIDPQLKKYINRLSDCIFSIARNEEERSFMDKVKSKVEEKLNQMEMCLDLELAKKMAEAANEKALEMNVPIVFSVVDKGGSLILLHRMKDSLLASLDISMGKAFTACALKLATHEVKKLSEPGKELYGIESTNKGKLVLFGGGYPVKIKNKIVGGIGVSGGTVEEDMIIAEEALKIRW